MVKVGITGGIGSGKSFVANLLAQKNFPVYDCDSNAKRIMRENLQLKSSLTELIGSEAFKNGKPNRQAIADFMFGNPEHTAQVNALVHPAVKDDFLQWASEQSDAPLCFMESAILFESGFQSVCDLNIAVLASEQIRMDRVQKRDALTEEQIRLRMETQMPQEEKARKADFVIFNNGTEDLQKQIDVILLHIVHYLLNQTKEYD